MSQAIAFNHRNPWHFRTLDHPYMFAFADWTFDRHGFFAQALSHGQCRGNVPPPINLDRV